MNLPISELLLRAANMVVCEERRNVDAGSVSTASRFKINSLQNSFAFPKCKSEGAVNCVYIQIHELAGKVCFWHTVFCDGVWKLE